MTIHRGGRAAACGALLAAVATMAFAVGPAQAKRGKVHACVARSGVMTFSPSGKCAKGERKLTWNKKGKRGKAGPKGADGAQGAPGADGSTAGIDQLTAQLNALEAQVNGLAPQVGALCAQLSNVTGQSDALLTVLGAVNDILDPLTILPLPTLPSALGAFTCPS